MFAYTDERLSLSAERGALLWCLRIWDMGSRRPAAASWQVAHVMDWLGAPDATAPFGGFMQALSQAATRIVGIDCVYGQRILEDEHLLLDVLGLAQAGRAFEALLLLRQIVGGEGASEVLSRATKLAMALAKAGRFLDAPGVATRHVAMAIRPLAPHDHAF